VRVLLGMTLIPGGARAARRQPRGPDGTDRWFNAPVDEILSAANQHRRRLLPGAAARGGDQAPASRARWPVDLAAPDVAPCAPLDAGGEPARRLVEVYRVVAGRARRQPAPVVDVAAPSLPQGWPRGGRPPGAQGWPRARDDDPHRGSRAAGGGGELLRAASRHPRRGGQAVGVVVASDYLTGELAERSRRMTRPTRTTRSCACCASRSPASTCRSS
jgi:hypothetical protein